MGVDFETKCEQHALDYIKIHLREGYFVSAYVDKGTYYWEKVYKIHVHCKDEQTESRDYVNFLKDIPSAQPKRGEWIRGNWYSNDSGFANPIVCSECNSVAPINLGEYELTNYCPNCGARMTDSEKPNNCEDEPLTCDGNCWMKKQNGEWLCEHCQRKPQTEPTGYNLSPVDKDINVRSNSSGKPNNCDTCRHYKLACELFSEICKYEPITQTETKNSNSTFEKVDEP